jgi:glycosyltransferase involved in cell wall biosynthesis
MGLSSENTQVRVLAFTENYARGGGNRYLIDTLNSLPSELNVRLAANPGGLERWDTDRLVRAPEVQQAWPIWTAARWTIRWHGHGAGRVGRRRLVNLTGLLLTPFFHLQNFVVFVARLLEHRPHLVIAFNGGYPGAPSILGLALAGRLLDIPVVMSVVSQPVARSARDRWLGGCLRDLLLRRTLAGIVVNAAVIGERLVSERGFAPARIQVVHNGVAERPPPPAREPGATFTLGYVGRIEASKGVWILLEAFARLRPAHPELRLELVGSGPDLERAREFCHGQGFADAVVFHGFQEGAIDAFFARWDLFVFPSLHEGFPYVVLEAMRAGVPILATRVGGIPEAIRSSQDGWLIAPGSIDELGRALERALRDPSLGRALAVSARARYEARFTLSAMRSAVQAAFSRWLPEAAPKNSAHTSA